MRQEKDDDDLVNFPVIFRISIILFLRLRVVSTDRSADDVMVERIRKFLHMTKIYALPVTIHEYFPPVVLYAYLFWRKFYYTLIHNINIP